ncbi:hypothetical protein RB195_021528 [Necator americanus]|uniref:Uncharacterized protein n=1 Tax=Necator americanus TaxID=51031 RepID=A0ABR1EBH3_NECAM
MGRRPKERGLRGTCRGFAVLTAKMTTADCMLYVVTNFLPTTYTLWSLEQLKEPSFLASLGSVQSHMTIYRLRLEHDGATNCPALRCLDVHQAAGWQVDFFHPITWPFFYPFRYPKNDTTL